MMFQTKDCQSAPSCILEEQNRLVAGYRDNYGPNSLLEISGYALTMPGKMIRGTLLLETCRAVGGSPELLLAAAACIEHGHLASLIHDDVIDRDELRRGQSTIWKAYGEEAAMLCGDLFIFAAMHSLSQCRHLVSGDRVARAFEVLSLACVELCLGQATEAQLSGKCSTRSPQYLAMIRQKTGSLVRASAEIGAVLGGGREEQISALRMYGEYLGMAFQIVDDLLPYMSEESTLRKPTGSDIKNRRMTLPIIYALEVGSPTERETLQNIFEKGYLADMPDKAKQIITSILRQTGALERVSQVARDYQQDALAQLARLPEKDGYTSLTDIAEFVVKRSM